MLAHCSRAHSAWGDSGDTLGLYLTATDVTADSIVYTKENGAYGNGKTLHVDSNGNIFEGDPSPGSITTPALDIGLLGAAQKMNYPEDVLVKIIKFDNKSITEGQNLFFTTKDSVKVVFSMQDKETKYTDSNLSTYLTDTLVTASGAGGKRAVRSPVSDKGGGIVEVTYTIYFSEQGGSATDNRITVYPKLTDEESLVNSKRSAVTVVRHSTAPTLVNGTNATVLGFAGGDSVIVPVTVSGLALGDWLAPIYNGSCGDGQTAYLARNGGHGMYYNLSVGTYVSCTLSATDSAGNTATAITLPEIIVGQEE